MRSGSLAAHPLLTALPHCQNQDAQPGDAVDSLDQVTPRSDRRVQRLEACSQATRWPNQSGRRSGWSQMPHQAEVWPARYHWPSLQFLYLAAENTLWSTRSAEGIDASPCQVGRLRSRAGTQRERRLPGSGGMSQSAPGSPMMPLRNFATLRVAVILVRGFGFVQVSRSVRSGPTLASVGG